MKVGDYVRTKSNGIQKIDDEGRINLGLIRPPFHIIKKEELLKSSPNIIDLIEVGDYVNGMKITNILIDKETNNIEFEFNEKESYLYVKEWNYESRVTKYKLKSIVTKEQFEAMQYKVGE